jgi:tape measure domain-containing protein
MAGTSIGSTALHLSADATEFEKGLDHAAKLFKTFTSRTKSEADQLRKEVKGGLGLGDVLKIGTGVAGGLAGAFGISALASGLAGIVTDSIKLAASVEDTATDFRVMLGDVEKAKKLFADIREFATKTPLTAGELSDAAKSLLGIGVAADQIVPTLKALGDLAGGQGEKLKQVALIYGKVRQEGKVSGEVLQQFAENNIPLVDSLAKVLKVSAAEVRGLAEEGKIGFPDLQKAIVAATSEGGRFFGLMDERSKTFNGLLSTLRDNWEQLQAAFGQVLIDEFGLKGFIERLSGTTETAKNNIDAIRPFVHEIAGLVKQIATDLFNGGFAFAKSIASAADALGEIRADYQEIKHNSVAPSGLAGFVGSAAAGMPAPFRALFASLNGTTVTTGLAAGSRTGAGPAEAAVDRIKAELDKIWQGAGPLLAGENIGKGFLSHVSAFTKAEGERLKIEADQLNRDMLKQVRGLRDEFDPLSKVQRELDDLRKIRDRGGFAPNGAGLLGGGLLAGQGGGGDLFAFAVGKLFQDVLGKFDFGKQVGIATKGSSEAVSSIINQQNVGLIKPEDKLLAAMEAARLQREAQIRIFKRVADLIEQRKIPGLF